MHFSSGAGARQLGPDQKVVPPNIFVYNGLLWLQHPHKVTIWRRLFPMTNGTKAEAEPKGLVSSADRLGRFSLTMAWWSLCSAMFYVFVGASLAIHFGTTNAVAGMVAAVALYTMVTRPLVAFSIRVGASVSSLSRLMFGSHGALIAVVLLGLTGVYYAVFEGSVLAVAMTNVIPGLDYGLACMLVVLFSAPLVAGRAQDFLGKLNTVLLPVYLGGLALLVFLIAQRQGLNAQLLATGPSGFDLYGAWQAFVAYMGIWAIVMVAVDFSQFGREIDSSYHKDFAFGVPFFTLTFLVSGVVGIILVSALNLTDVTEISVLDAVLATMGGILGLVFVWCTQVRINTTNFYVAATNLRETFETLAPVRSPSWLWATLVGIVVALLMRSTDVFSTILTALAYQGVFMTAWVGVALPVVIADRRSIAEVAEALASAPRWRWPAVSTWMLAAGIGLLLLQTPYSTVAPPISFITALAFQAIAARRPQPSQSKNSGKRFTNGGA